MEAPEGIKHVLANYDLAPSKEHPNCMVFEIEPRAVAPAGEKGDGEVWRVPYKHEVTEIVQLSGVTNRSWNVVGTSETSVAIEDGHIIVTNLEGVKASLKLPNHISQSGPVVAVNPDKLHVTVPRAVKA